MSEEQLQELWPEMYGEESPSEGMHIVDLNK